MTVGPGAAQSVRYWLNDVDGERDWDLVLNFKIPETGIRCGDSELSLTAGTFDGAEISGTDSIRTVGCKPGKSDSEHRGKLEKKQRDRDDGGPGKARAFY